MLKDIKLLSVGIRNNDESKTDEVFPGLESLILEDEQHEEQVSDTEEIFEEAKSLDTAELQIEAYSRLLDIRECVSIHGMSKSIGYLTMEDEMAIVNLPEEGDPESEESKAVISEIDVALEGLGNVGTRIGDSIKKLLATLKKKLMNLLDIPTILDNNAKVLAGKKFNMEKFNKTKLYVHKKPYSLELLKRLVEIYAAFELAIKELKDYKKDPTKSELLGGKAFIQYLKAIGAEYETLPNGTANIWKLKKKTNFNPTKMSIIPMGESGWKPQDFVNTSELKKFMPVYKRIDFTELTMLAEMSRLWAIKTVATSGKPFDKQTLKNAGRYIKLLNFCLTTLSNVIDIMRSELDSLLRMSNLAKKCIIS